MTTRLMHGITKKKPIFDLSAVKISEPSTLKQALNDPNWTQAMDLEMPYITIKLGILSNNLQGLMSLAVNGCIS
jgi:hypothetical protein